MDYEYKEKKIVLYSLINGVGSSTIAYQLARLLRLPLYQEKRYDLVDYLKNVLNPTKYTVNLISELKDLDEEYGAIYDLETPNKHILNIATDIIVLTNNSYLDVLKTISTLQQIQECIYNKVITIHVVFNRLQNGTPAREKRYTDKTKALILENTSLDIKFSYIRTNFIYYKQISDGKFFMDSFFKANKELLSKYPDITNVEHTEHLQVMFDRLYNNKPYSFKHLIEYEYIDMIDEKIAKLNYKNDNIKNARVVIKDMYILLYNLGNIYQQNDKFNNKFLGY